VPDPKLLITGGCMCGAVRFEIVEPLTGARYCHCTRCQRRTGTGFSVGAQTAPGSFRFVAGADRVSAYDPGGGGWLKSFCRMGALDADPGIRPSAHQFCLYAPAWSPVPDDGLPHHPERDPSA
jgi:hypothetical protein